MTAGRCSIVLLAGVVFLSSANPLWAQDDIPQALADARPFRDNAPAELLERSRAILDQVDPESTPGWALEALDLAIDAAIDLGLLDEAEAWAQQELEIAQQQGDPQSIAAAHQDLGNVDMAGQRYPEAMAHLRKAVEELEPLGESARLAAVYGNVGQAYRYQTQYAPALSYYQRALAIYEAQENLAGISSQMNSIGVVLELMGDYEGSLDAHTQSLAIGRQTNDVTGVATSLYNIGEIYRELGDLNEALRYFQESLEMDLRAGNPGDIAYSRNMMGQTLMDLGQLDAAREQITEAVALFQQIQAPRDVAWAESMLGRVEFRAGNLELARELLTGALETALERNSRTLIPIVRMQLVELDLVEGDIDSARAHVEAGLAETRANDEKEKQEEFYRLLTDVFEAENNYEGALRALRDRLSLREEIFRQSRAHAIAQMQSEVESIRQEQEIERLQLEKQIQQAELQRQQWTRNAWVAGLSVGFLLLFLVYSRFAQASLNRQLSLQVADRTRQLKHKNQELNQAYQELEDISLTDQLTGLRNRRFLESNLAADLDASLSAYRRWIDEGGDPPRNEDLVFFLIDLDRFKPINDTYGHIAGDAVLEQVRPLLSAVFRPADYLIRWGGEEFLVVARQTDRRSAPELAERIRSLIEQHRFETPNVRLELTGSIGFAPFPFVRRDPEAADWEEVLDLADTCLYAAKANGRNAWMGSPGVNDLPSSNEANLAARFVELVRSGTIPVNASLDVSTIGWLENEPPGAISA